MRAHDTKFLDLLHGRKLSLKIPAFQRNYNWKKKDSEKLFDDIERIIENNYTTHFMGSVVLNKTEDGALRELKIIDGQQRLTTLSLLLLAIYKLLKGNVRKSVDHQPDDILDDFLINRGAQNSEQKIKLKHTKDDSENFRKLFSDNTNITPDSNIVVNFNYFKDKISYSNYEIDQIMRALDCLVTVEIELEKQDDPQLIYESINSTGLSLSQADLVRNFVLMDLNEEEQNQYYQDYWVKIEQNTKYDYVSNFLRNYLTLKERRIPREKEVYINFKNYVNRNNYENNIKKLLQDIVKFSEYYKQIAFCESDYSDLNNALKNINNIEITVCYPFLLEVFDFYHNKKLSRDEVLNIIKLIEAYCFRRIICDMPSNVLNKIFASVGKDITQHPDYHTKYLEIFKFELSNLSRKSRFPTDEEFIIKLGNKNIYEELKHKIYLFHNLEKYNNKEFVDIEAGIRSKELSIEHIMPQKLTNSWIDELGKNHHEIYEKYLHALGNLTITGYNRKYSNKTFKEKKDMKKGFKESNLQLNDFLKTCNKWNERNIKERAKKLSELAVKIWSYPRTEYKPKGKIEKSYALNEQIAVTNKTPIYFYITEDIYELKDKTWRELFQKVCNIFFELDPKAFSKVIKDLNVSTAEKKRTILSQDMSELVNPKKLNESYYYEGHQSADSILNNVKLILTKYKIDLEDFTITII